MEGPATSGILRACKRKPDDTIATMDPTPRGKKGDKPQNQFDKILHNKRCPIHPKSNHSMWECTILRKSFQSTLPYAPKKKQNKDDEHDKKDPDGFQQQQNIINVIFGGDTSFSKRAHKLLLREILSIEPTIQRPLKYSEVSSPSLGMINGLASLKQESFRWYLIQLSKDPSSLEYSSTAEAGTT